MKNKSKRLLVLILVLLLAFLLPACGKKSGQGGESGTQDPVTTEESQSGGEGGTTYDDEDYAEYEEDYSGDDSDYDEPDDEFYEDQQNDTSLIDEHGTYDQKDDVALYIHVYGRLPDNYITKKEAEKLGWQGGSVEQVAPGKCIGGNHYGNYEKALPKGNYKECDIGTLGKKKRGAKRIIYSDNGDIYYTDDHYESFVKLYDKNGACS